MVVAAALTATALASGWLLAAPAVAGPLRAQSTTLGTAGSFDVLAGSGITNTGPTTVNGDVGTYPTPDETGFSSVTFAAGTNHDADAVTQGAKLDLTTAYDQAAGRSGTSVPAELGGTILLAGVYSSPTFGLTGTVTLDAQGDPDAEFIFQAGSTLTTAADSHVLLIGGATACNVVWQIGSSATFGTGTAFAGSVLAHTSITATTGATFLGRLLAESGAVTLDTNTITAPNCTTAPASPSPSPTSTITSTPTAPSSTAPAAGGGTTATPTVVAGSSAPARPGSSQPAGTMSSTAAAFGLGRTGAADVATDTSAGDTATGTTSTAGLPFTGLPAAELTAGAVALVAGGGLALFLGRRRKLNWHR